MLSRPVTFAATLFFGSFLMFWLEPMVAKLLLPSLGGAPMVWNTCMVFFQGSLLAGYAYAHGSSRWPGTRWHAVSFIVLFVLATLSLPIGIRASPPALASWPGAWLLGALTVSIGLPFLVLAACAPTLQRWFAEADHPAASDPYWLYAASNAGSLLALLLYPLAIEPLLSLSAQRRLWTIGFITFGFLAASCAFTTFRHPTGMRNIRTEARRTAERISWNRRLAWTALSAVPSSLLLAVTSYLSTDIAAVPLLWIAPLSLYLFTFVIAFGVRSAVPGRLAAERLPLLVTALVMFMAGGVGGPLWLVVPVHLLTFTLAALACHGRLAQERPAPALLTEYYLWLALGGMVGGLFNTFAAPLLFDSVVEYPVALLAAAVLTAAARAPDSEPESRARDLGYPVATASLTAALIIAIREADLAERLLVPALGLPALLAFTQSRQAFRFTVSLAGMLAAAGLTWQSYGHVLHTERTFFGTYRVTAYPQNRTRALYHGTTLHGVEAYEGPDRGEPLTYYHRGGPFGQAFEALPAMSGATEVAAIGLGVGSLAAYAQPHQRWTFFEIDPAVERIARSPEYFTHLAACGDRCRVVIGDARLSLASRSGDRFGLLVLDAFSSDAIPIHLVTREALALYLSRLTSNGVLAFHVSNRHLALAPVMARLAADANLVAFDQQHDVTREEALTGRNSSQWIVMARNDGSLAQLKHDARWRRLMPHPEAAVWTDDFSNILSVLKF